jgi:bifunctional UDP-N-acetylglucosamine pyrophosphorylase/glucosamine-1-phosphate N-acetyltransferase
MAGLKKGCVILAAGKGTRMHSPLPKVLQRLLDEPLLGYVYETMDSIFDTEVYTIVGFGRDEVQQAFPGRSSRFIVQKEQLGTGHAVQVAWPTIRAAGLDLVVVANGDTPLVPARAVGELLRAAEQDGADLAFLSIPLDDPTGYGRVVRSPDGRVSAVVEDKDFDPTRFGGEIREVNSGIYVFRAETIEPLLDRLGNDNRQGEFYITQLVDLAVARGLDVRAVSCDDPGLFGINSPQELIRSEEMIRASIVESWLREGVLVRQPDTVRIGPRVHLGKGVSITGPCEVYGASVIEDGGVLESHTVIRDSELRGCTIHSFSHVQECVVAPGAAVGPYGRLRPGSRIGPGARVGNFVEVKKGVLGPGSKAGHLSYIGDCEIGSDVNIGAGTITCNYDGRNKHKTIIEDGVFVGSNTALVAPVTLGRASLVGAGSVVTKSVPENGLCIARAKQKNITRSR